MILKIHWKFQCFSEKKHYQWMFFGLWPLTSMVFGLFHHRFQWFSMARNTWSNDGMVSMDRSALSWPPLSDIFFRVHTILRNILGFNMILSYDISDLVKNVRTLQEIAWNWWKVRTIHIKSFLYALNAQKMHKIHNSCCYMSDQKKFIK